MEKNHPCCNQEQFLDTHFEQLKSNEKRTLWVVMLTLVMMVIEILAGYWTGSMALLADGYHMASHAGALGMAYWVYKLAQSPTLKSQMSFGSGKLLSLGGYTSALALGAVALWMVWESIEKFLAPSPIQFKEAIAIAVLGLFTNLLSALILGGTHNHHHDDPHAVHDHNHRSAVIHVLTDALTSLFAIVALIVGLYTGWHWFDPLIGVLGALVILRWAYLLSRDSAWELLDRSPPEISITQITEAVQQGGNRLLDLHIWRVGPGNHACQMIVETSEKVGSEHYRKLLPKSLHCTHLIVEERLK